MIEPHVLFHVILTFRIQVDGIDLFRVCVPADYRSERSHAGEHVDDDLSRFHHGGYTGPFVGETGVEVDLGGIGLHPGPELLVHGLGGTGTGDEFEFADAELSLHTAVEEDRAYVGADLHHGFADGFTVWEERFLELGDGDVPDHIVGVRKKLPQVIWHIDDVAVVALFAGLRSELCLFRFYAAVLVAGAGYEKIAAVASDAVI